MGTFDTSMDDTATSRKLQSIPKLAENGSNWLIYKTCLTTAINAKAGLRRHLDGTACLPDIPSLPAESSPSPDNQAMTRGALKAKEEETESERKA